MCTTVVEHGKIGTQVEYVEADGLLVLVLVLLPLQKNSRLPKEKKVFSLSLVYLMHPIAFRIPFHDGKTSARSLPGHHPCFSSRGRK